MGRAGPRGIAYKATANAADCFGHDTIYWSLDYIVESLIDDTLISEDASQGSVSEQGEMALQEPALSVTHGAKNAL